LTTYQPQYLTKPTATGDLLHACFETQANISPDRTAVVCLDQQLSYHDLDRVSNQLARYLQALNIGKGSRVGLLMERSINVYIAVLGILKVGAAYVPMDPDYPADRVEYILQDSGVELLLTSATLLTKHPGVACPTLCLEQELRLIAQQDDNHLHDVAVASSDLCYIIYTSGSTGRPKGVMLEHHSIANFVRAAQQVYEVQATDRFYQGFSIAFDASIEEIWLTFAAGATLVVGTAAMVKAGSDLSRILTQLGVTVFSCVPTLLSMLKEDLPLVRLLILGGEACQPELIQRWHRPDRRILNTYGPTEASVVATYAECYPDQPITIGRPLPTYQVHILDEELLPVAVGVSGQIFIGGDCLARGYVNLEDLTKEKFIWHLDAQTRLYKSGDLGCWTSNGDIRFLGRADDQVKLRGFRVELAEIESVLMECPVVSIAVVALKEQVVGIQSLVAYLVLLEQDLEQLVDLEAIRTHLRNCLPGFMMPTCFHRLKAEELPRLASGKVDRNHLPQPIAMLEAPALRPDFQAPTNPIEAKIAQVWETLLNTNISIDDDFFDLGGHSLLAAAMVSELRLDPQLQQIAVSDVYHYPTVTMLAAHLASQQVVQQSAPLPHPQVGLQYWITVFGQLLGIYGVQTLVSLNILIPTFAHHLSNSLWDFVGALMLMYPAMLIVSILAKWLIIGRYRSGSYPLWGAYYFRWWLARQMQGIVPIWPLIGTPFVAWYYRLMGAQIGKDCYLGTDEIGSFDLIKIGDETSLGAESHLLGHSISDGYLHLGTIEIGDCCFVGARSVLEPNTRMADDSQLEDLSLLPTAAIIPASESWHGSPARLVTSRPLVVSSPAGKSTDPWISLWRGCWQILGIIILNLLPIAAMMPSLLLQMHLGDLWGWSALLVAPFAGLLAVVLLATEIVLLKKIVSPRVKPGVYSIHSSFYLRKWWIDRLLQMSLQWLGSFYGTLYSAPWLRLLGAKVGSQTEVSTAANFSPELLTIGSDCFIADDVCLGAPRVHRGWMELQPVQIGHGSFIGNSALIPAQTTIGSDCLIGCLSVPPVQQEVPHGTSWAGSPAFCLPQRQQHKQFDAGLTFKPSRKLVSQRLLMEFIRVIMPLSCTVTLLSTLLYVLGESDELTFLELIAVMPLWSLGAGLIASVLVIITKWLVVGRYRSQSLPLWDHYVWRSEMITGMYETIALPWLIESLLGTPFIAWYWRCLGAQVGKRVYIESPYITEFDLIHIGDCAALNYNAGLQTHLFEDRVMKMSHVHIGKRCVVGDTAIVLYDTQMKTGAQLGSLSLLMKGETLPANSLWQGIPAQHQSGK
jgi:non-ribosomal peptide synthetase-like protein